MERINYTDESKQSSGPSTNEIESTAALVAVVCGKLRAWGAGRSARRIGKEGETLLTGERVTPVVEHTPVFKTKVRGGRTYGGGTSKKSKWNARRG
jgi:hypothetical protein